MATASKNEIEKLLPGDQSFTKLDDQISSLILDPSKHGKYWFLMLGMGFLGVNILVVSIAYLLYNGIGVWGNNQPVGWGFDIINFVWWIGIGHAGTLISAVLLLVRQSWRNSINRFAEAMTIFAVMCAGLYPLLHTGRPWVAYWLFPYPNVLNMWPQFRSPLVWDVFAVTTYITISALFWFIGLIPDFATLRDKSKGVGQKVWGLLSMGWNGSNKHWHRYEQSYLILAGISTPLVLSVHSIVSLDFAVSIVPGWNVTLFPPYFVAGAVFAGFAMVLTFAIPMRAKYGFKDIITMEHIDWMCKIMLTTGLIVFFGYLCEFFFAYYSGVEVEMFLMKNRMTGPYAWAFWSLWLCNGLIPQALWFPAVRKNVLVVWIICQFISVGMWLERFVIIPMSLHRDYLPSSWGMYYPRLADFGFLLGTIGFFVFMMALFFRFLPVINIFEMKVLAQEKLHSPSFSGAEHIPTPDCGKGNGGGE